jgi:hypothetical protein
MKIAFLHTAQVHVETFDALVNTMAPDTDCAHHVAPDLLARAQINGLQDVEQEVADILNELSNSDAVVCTCSTLGPLVDTIAVSHPNVIRVDRPLMDRACTFGPDVLVAICLESTRNATLALLDNCAEQMGKAITPRLVLCASAWPFFEAGDNAGFAAEISKSIRAEIAMQGTPDCIVLAQASMRVAAPELEDIGPPVLSSPMLAVQHALALGPGLSERPLK